MKNLIEIKGSMNPTVIRFGDVTYAISGCNWTPVPHGTQLSDLKWIRPVYKTPKSKNIKPGGWKFLSPHGTREYTVRWDGTKLTCECLGFLYRKKCKHVTEIETTLGWKKKSLTTR